MIAKRILREGSGGPSSFARLGKYLLEAKGRIDPSTWERTADYLLDTVHAGAKVGSVRITNCISVDPAMATAEIMRTQERNTRSKADKTYHLVVSFPPGERPTVEQLNYIEDELCASIGFKEHQRLSVVHLDTDHLHIHVAINKVHPVKLSNIEPYFDKRSLMRTCARLEVELGLTRTHERAEVRKEKEDRPLTVGEGGDPVQLGSEEARNLSPAWQVTPGLGGAAAAMEAHGARQSLTGWIRERAGGLPDVGSWDEFHRRLAALELMAQLRGAGLIVGTRDGIFVKASDIDRQWSLGSLRGRWGDFQAASAEVDRIRPKETYSAGPKQSGGGVDKLFAEFLAERQCAHEARRVARERIVAAMRRHTGDLVLWYEKERARIRADKRLRGRLKLQALKELSGRKRQDLRLARKIEQEQVAQARSGSPLKTWQGFLEGRAAAGELEALQVLRTRGRGRSSANVVGGGTERRPAAPARERSAFTFKNGDILYVTPDGGRVVNTSAGLRIDHPTPRAGELALDLARERYPAQRLHIDGTAEFRVYLAKIARDSALSVQFADSTLEGERLSHSTPNGWRPSSLDAFIDERNQLRSQLPTLSSHRRWTPSDAGTVIYRGTQRFADGSEAFLLQRGDTVLMLPVSASHVTAAAQWQEGRAVAINAAGELAQKTSRGMRR